MPRRTSPNDPNAIYDQRITVGGKRKRLGDLTGSDWASLGQKHERFKAFHTHEAKIAALVVQMLGGTPADALR